MKEDLGDNSGSREPSRSVSALSGFDPGREDGDLEKYAHVYISHWTRQPGNPLFCRAAVHGGGRGVGFYQCGRKPVVTRRIKGEDCGFCRQHDPVNVRERRTARDRAWQAEWVARDAEYARQAAERKARAGCIEALRQIEAGHNDPRTVAREALAALDAAAKL